MAVHAELIQGVVWIDAKACLPKFGLPARAAADLARVWIDALEASKLAAHYFAVHFLANARARHGTEFRHHRKGAWQQDRIS